MTVPGTDSTSTLVDRRAGSAFTIAREFHRRLPLEEFLALLPEEGPTSRGQVLAWLQVHPEFQSLAEDLLEGLHDASPDPLRDERRLRSVGYVRAAAVLLDTTLRPLRRMVCCVGVTGSTAYGEPGAGDDCDFLVVTHNGATWAFLGLVFLRLRLEALAGRDRGDPVWCFNYVVDDRSIRLDYLGSRGFLFAREALMVRPLEGEEYYRGLLGSSAWLRAEAPRLFARWEQGGLPEKFPEALRAGMGIRLLNILAFPWVAAYLQAIGLLRNARHRRAGDADSEFRTVTLPGRMTFLVAKFDRLRGIYASGSATDPESGPISRAPGEAAPGPTGPASPPPPPPSEAPEGSESPSG